MRLSRRVEFRAAASVVAWLLLSMTAALHSDVLAGDDAGGAAATARRPPDILIVMLDDAGWTDVGCFGSAIETPHIDRLAREGVRFTDCHAAAPNCSPARAGMLTGRMPTRVGIYSFIPTSHPMHLRGEEVTIAEVLKSNGYATGHFGKWHLSELGGSRREQPQPTDQGFDVSFGTANNAGPSHKDPTNFVRNGDRVGPLKGYSCDLVVSAFGEWLGALDADQPMFGAVWFHEPHTKIASPTELVAKYEARGLRRNQAAYYANVENADRAIGRLLALLEESGRGDNTLVFFTSDNGGVNRAWSNNGLRGKKGSVYEGGHRVPGIIRWRAGGVAAGRVDDTAIGHVDLFPTICEVAGITPPEGRKLDGTSIAPLLQKSRAALDRKTPLMWFFYRTRPAAAMRDGDWAIVGYLDDPMPKHERSLTEADLNVIKTAPLARFELYDLSKDLVQKHDVAAAHPERLARMRAQMIELHQDVVEDGPTWDLSKGR